MTKLPICLQNFYFTHRLKLLVVEEMVKNCILVFQTMNIFEYEKILYDAYSLIRLVYIVKLNIQFLS